MSNNLEKYYANKNEKIANVLFYGFFILFIVTLVLLVVAWFVIYQQEKFYNQRTDFLINQIKHCKSSDKEIINF